MHMGQLRITLRDVFCTQKRTSTSQDTTLDHRCSRSFIHVSNSTPCLTIINGMRSSSSIANAYDFRVLDLLMNNMVCLLRVEFLGHLMSVTILARWDSLIEM
jgi:hypothetical protein